jgi:hypothetical protein
VTLSAISVTDECPSSWEKYQVKALVLCENTVEKSVSALAAPQGFEPRYADPESAVLPLNEGAVFGL